MAKLLKFSPRYGSAFLLDVTALKQSDIQALVGLLAVLPAVNTRDWCGEKGLHYVGYPDIRLVVREDVYENEAAANAAEQEAEKAAKVKETAEA